MLSLFSKLSGSPCRRQLYLNSLCKYMPTFFLFSCFCFSDGNAKNTHVISTKVLYFTEKTVTPFLTSIPRRYLLNTVFDDFNTFCFIWQQLPNLSKSRECTVHLAHSSKMAIRNINVCENYLTLTILMADKSVWTFSDTEKD